jgi:hypothetical protein
MAEPRKRFKPDISADEADRRAVAREKPRKINFANLVDSPAFKDLCQLGEEILVRYRMEPPKKAEEERAYQTYKIMCDFWDEFSGEMMSLARQGIEIKKEDQ